MIEDLKSLGAKKFYGKFCAGNIDHASIRQLQLILLKVALICGCEFHENVSFEEVCPRYLVPASKQSQQQASDNLQKSSGNASSRCSAVIQGLDPSAAVDECSCCCHEHELGLDEWCGGSSSQTPASVPTGAVAHFSFTSNPSVLSTTFVNPSTSQTNLSSKQSTSKGALSQDLNNFKRRLNSYRFEILIGADGRRNTLSDNFTRKEFRGESQIAAILWL